MLKCPGNLGLSEGTKISGKKKKRQQSEKVNTYFDFFKIISFKNLDRQSLRLKAVVVAPKYPAGACGLACASRLSFSYPTTQYLPQQCCFNQVFSSGITNLYRILLK